MAYNSTSNPFFVVDSDDENEVTTRCDRSISFSLPPKPPTPRTLRRSVEPKIPDWSPVITGERYRRRFGHAKTGPSLERAPSHHRPIFSGSPNLKSSRSTSLSSSRTSLFEQNQPDKKLVNYIPETPPASPLVNNFNFDPIGFIQENLTKFIYTYIPKEYPAFIDCFVRRDRSGLQKGFFPTYYLHIERPGDGRKIFLLAARKVAKINRQSEYIITTNIETLNEKSGGDGCVGRLRGNNASGAEYTLYDSGKSPNRYGYKPSHNKQGLRRELAAVIYNTNIHGYKAPRQINALIPKLETDIHPAQGEDTILDRWRDTLFGDVLHLRNHSQKYTDETKIHMPQFFSDSVVKPSVKNFQMMIETENHQEEVVMQFGRVHTDTFTCSYRYPISAIQAFGIALSSLDSGFARE